MIARTNPLVYRLPKADATHFIATNLSLKSPLINLTKLCGESPISQGLPHSSVHKHLFVGNGL